MMQGSRWILHEANISWKCTFRILNLVVGEGEVGRGYLYCRESGTGSGGYQSLKVMWNRYFKKSTVSVESGRNDAADGECTV
jgi:hypothetical protein